MTNYGEYDFGSVMHYEETSFSRHPDKHNWVTITPKKRLEDLVLKQSPTGRIGQRIRLSQTDVAKINAMYNCAPQTTMAPTPSSGTLVCAASTKTYQIIKDLKVSQKSEKLHYKTNRTDDQFETIFVLR